MGEEKHPMASSKQMFRRESSPLVKGSKWGLDLWFHVTC